MASSSNITTITRYVIQVCYLIYNSLDSTVSVQSVALA
uniref:Uncharacterized protein n=1 Tax=Anguilla anguilla TaxID=7936 RepID=A0A0E9WE40_ANGAN